MYVVGGEKLTSKEIHRALLHLKKEGESRKSLFSNVSSYQHILIHQTLICICSMVCTNVDPKLSLLLLSSMFFITSTIFIFVSSVNPLSPLTLRISPELYMQVPHETLVAVLRQCLKLTLQDSVNLFTQGDARDVSSFPVSDHIRRTPDVQSIMR